MSGTSGQRPLQPASSADLPPRRAPSPESPQTKRLSTACLECKKKKRKCSAKAPCSGCVANNVTCIFDENLDKRRKVSAKRTSDELGLYKEVVAGLLDALRASNASDLEEITALALENVSVSDLALHFHRRIGIHKEDSGSSASWSEKQPTDLEQLEDIIKATRFLAFVPAKPWTNVTDSSQVTSFLVSLYLTWHHPLFSLFDVNIFLQEAQAGTLDAKICSPFLVNAVLAMGWQLADHQHINPERRNKNSLGDRFFNEASRLWGLQLGQPSLSSLSGLTIMAQLAYFRGRDKLGVMFLSQAAVIYRELCLPRRRSLGRTSLSVEDIEQSLSIAAWGFALTQSLFFYILIKPSQIRIPQIPMPSQRLVAPETSQWTPYPRSEPRPWQPELFVQCVCSLTKIIIEIQDCVFDEERPITPAEYQLYVHRYRSMLDHWHSNLPPELDLGNASPSHHFCLRLAFHSIYIILHVKASPDLTADNDFLLDARNTKIYNAHQLAVLCKQHRSLYARDAWPMMVPQASYISIMILLEDLGRPNSREALVEMCTLLRAASASVYVAKGMLRLIKPTAARFGVQLPKEAQDLLDKFESSEWQDTDYRQFSSGYPNYAFEENISSQDSFEMGDLLKKFESQAKLRVWE